MESSKKLVAMFLVCIVVLSYSVHVSNAADEDSARRFVDKAHADYAACFNDCDEDCTHQGLGFTFCEVKCDEDCTDQLLKGGFLTCNFFNLLLDFQFPHPILQGFGMFVELEDEFEELVHAIVGKEGVEHMVMCNMLDMEVGKQSIMDLGRDYGELGYKLGLETDDNDDIAFLDVLVLQL
ncbi:hypothetical protein T459_15771 [Capsicum annuum]|uniref:Major pollen allergen Ole e 6-like n=1 Tax=Capsicum annuum TaxID=4072 RepID=A0A2G2Z6X1_CAPAN|nr:hypothetical protein T459_15771 [Capsicum annuum]